MYEPSAAVSVDELSALGIAIKQNSSATFEYFSLSIGSWGIDDRTYNKHLWVFPIDIIVELYRSHKM